MEKYYCHYLWTELEERLPDKGKNYLLLQGNWSCWKNGQHVMGSKGMDCWQVVDTVISTANPKTILEIGFNGGHSCLMWLARSPTVKITSVDIRNSESVMAGVSYVKEKFPDRFNFICSDSKDLHNTLKGQTFDLVIVDGGHSEEVCHSDLELSKMVGAKYVVVDDIIMVDSVKSATEKFSQANSNFKLIKQWNVAWGVSFFEFV